MPSYRTKQVDENQKSVYQDYSDLRFIPISIYLITFINVVDSAKSE